MSRSIEDTIGETAQIERNRAPAFSFAPMYAFLTNAVMIAKGQERQDIMDALPKGKPDGMTPQEAKGYEKAMAAVVRILVQRSIVV
jgi:hypothetical protein